mmetsp:Transcript_55001/g.108629  ORF Transcript_55001/g.108629 Transcript_55001/m.108629 type:complete len:297 (-) Transcript_55001:448-1338(-)
MPCQNASRRDARGHPANVKPSQSLPQLLRQLRWRPRPFHHRPAHGGRGVAGTSSLRRRVLLLRHLQKARAPPEALHRCPNRYPSSASTVSAAGSHAVWWASAEPLRALPASPRPIATCRRRLALGNGRPIWTPVAARRQRLCPKADSSTASPRPHSNRRAPAVAAFLWPPPPLLRPLPRGPGNSSGRPRPLLPLPRSAQRIQKLNIRSLACHGHGWAGAAPKALCPKRQAHNSASTCQSPAARTPILPLPKPVLWPLWSPLRRGKLSYPRRWMHRSLGCCGEARALGVVGKALLAS